MLLFATGDWGAGESSSLRSPTSLILLTSGPAEESGLYFPPRTPEESWDRTQTGDLGEWEAVGNLQPPSSRKSYVKALEGRCSAEALRQQKRGLWCGQRGPEEAWEIPQVSIPKENAAEVLVFPCTGSLLNRGIRFFSPTEVDSGPCVL